MKRFLQMERCSGSISSIKSIGTSKARINIYKVLIIVLVSLISAGVAEALPSFARQTGMSCTACHYSFPELTPFGRQFKLNGYTMTMAKTIDVKEDSDKVTRLKLLDALPISAMIQTSFTHIAKDNAGVQNNSVAFPQQFSLFYAGQIAPHIGTFIQTTYDGVSFGMDNADLRYANQTNIGGKSLGYGITLNNNPTVQDGWNTTSAWGFPYASSPAANSPTKSTILENMGMQVAGLGAYSLYNNFLFTELTLYRTCQQGAANPADATTLMTIDGVAPYWRVALQHSWGNNYAALGTFGIHSNHFQTGINGPKDNFTDLGFDFQYAHTMNVGSLTLHSSLIKETENREDSTLTSSKYNFNSFKVDGNLYLKNGLGATVCYFNRSGSEDTNIGSLNNKPNSSGLIYQIEYLPFYNTKFSIQYVAYNKFDGNSVNYDGAGRNAAHNNTIYLLAWFNF